MIQATNLQHHTTIPTPAKNTIENVGGGSRRTATPTETSWSRRFASSQSDFGPRINLLDLPPFTDGWGEWTLAVSLAMSEDEAERQDV